MLARVTFLVIVIVGAAPGAIAADKPGWMLSDEERIRLRTDPELAKERVRAAARDRQRLRDEGMPVGPDGAIPAADHISGRRNPELFLATELFEGLVSRAYFGAAASAWREIHAKDLAAAGLPADFWVRLEDVIPTYLEAAGRERALLSRGQRADQATRDRLEREMVGMQPTLCWTLFDALAAARAAFGPALDRFLYEGIAPTRSVASSIAPSADQLRFRARGCR